MNFNESAGIALSACISFEPEVSGLLYSIAVSTISNKTGSFHVFRALCSVCAYLSDSVRTNGNVYHAQTASPSPKIHRRHITTHTAHATAIGAIKMYDACREIVGSLAYLSPFYIVDHGDKFYVSLVCFILHWWRIPGRAWNHTISKFTICGLSTKRLNMHVW